MLFYRFLPGMGKTGVVALACLSELQTTEDHIFALVLCQKSDLIIFKNVSKPKCILRLINKFDFENFKYFILDECDEMLNTIGNLNHEQTIFLQINMIINYHSSLI